MSGAGSSAAAGTAEARPRGSVSAGALAAAAAGGVRAFGEIVAGLKPGKHRRSGEPVWRNSYYEGQIEDRVWRPIAGGSIRAAARFRGAVLKAAREIERKTRRARQEVQPGTRNGFIGQVGLDVLEALWHFVDFATGRLEPAIATLAEWTGHSYSAVHSALNRLRRAGFLHWMRRSRPTGRTGEAGPQVEQIPNAYALLIPADVEKLVRHLFTPPPVPDDEAWRREDRKAEWQRMLAGISATQFHKEVCDGGRGASVPLALIAAALDAQDERWTGRSANRRRREKPGASVL